MTEICIIRHGQTDWNALHKIQGISDIPLNETGRAQASFVAKYLKKEKWDIVYTSPLKRAKETADIIAQASGITTINIEEKLIECDFGIAEGMKIKERKLVYPDRDLIPEAEKLEDLRSRAEKIITLISERHKDKRILIVSHACLIMEILAIFSKGEINGRQTQLKNLAMTLLTRDSEWNIPWYNRTAEELEPPCVTG